MVLKTLLEEFHDKMAMFSGGILRSVGFTNISNKVMVAIGMRRTGKTHLMFQTMRELLKTVPLSRVLYINFEDDRLFPLTQEQFVALIDDFYSIYPRNHDETCYLFFDEIQNVEDWQRVIRRYLDTKNVQIYLTGSSAKLLSKEIATSLRGRSVITEVWPFSFQEFLLAHNILDQTPVVGKKSVDQLTPLLATYLKEGGFPEMMNLGTTNRTRILQDYVSVVTFRDIVERYKITNLNLIRYMIKTLIKNVGTSFSVNKLFHDLKSQGFAIGKTTIHDYLGYIEDAYLNFSVPLYSESVRKTQVNYKKIYAIDTGLACAYNMTFSPNLGHYFENLIFLDLKRAQHTIYYYLTQSRYEVDFLTQDLQGEWHLYQVSWNTESNETMEREMRALQQAESELGIKGKLITPQTYLADGGVA